jgi:hypothetical protein
MWNRRKAAVFGSLHCFPKGGRGPERSGGLPTAENMTEPLLNAIAKTLPVAARLRFAPEDAEVAPPISEGDSLDAETGNSTVNHPGESTAVTRITRSLLGRH